MFNCWQQIWKRGRYFSILKMKSTLVKPLDKNQVSRQCRQNPSLIVDFAQLPLNTGIHDSLIHFSSSSNQAHHFLKLDFPEKMKPLAWYWQLVRSHNSWKAKKLVSNCDKHLKVEVKQGLAWASVTGRLKSEMTDGILQKRWLWHEWLQWGWQWWHSTAL